MSREVHGSVKWRDVELQVSSKEKGDTNWHYRENGTELMLRYVGALDTYRATINAMGLQGFGVGYSPDDALDGAVDSLAGKVAKVEVVLTRFAKQEEIG